MVSDGGDEGHWFNYIKAAQWRLRLISLLQGLRLIGGKPEHGIVSEASGAGEQSEAPSNKDPTLAPQNGWHPEERQHRKWERGYWRWSLLLAFAATGGALGTAIVAVGTLREAQKTTVAALQQASQAIAQTKIAQDNLIASTRPWIQFIGVEVTRIEVQNDRVLVSTDFSFKNIGRSPAQAIFVDAHLVPEGDSWSFLEANAFCAARVQGLDVGITLLPIVPHGVV